MHDCTSALSLPDMRRDPLYTVILLQTHARLHALPTEQTLFAMSLTLQRCITAADKPEKSSDACSAILLKAER